MMKRERKALTEKGLLKLIERIKNGEALDSQHRIFRGYNITITKAHCSAAEEMRWYYKKHPEAVERRHETQRKLRVFRKENGLCFFCGKKALKRKGKTYIQCKNCHEKNLKQQQERKQIKRQFERILRFNGKSL
jgi:ribosomal protein L37AE/L43A